MAYFDQKKLSPLFSCIYNEKRENDTPVGLLALNTKGEDLKKAF